MRTLYAYYGYSQEARFQVPITAYLRPLEMKAELEVPGTVSRHLRIVQTGENSRYDWSIAELHVIRE